MSNISPPVKYIVYIIDKIVLKDFAIVKSWQSWRW